MDNEIKDHKNVLAALKVDSIAMSDGKAVLSAEQMNALDTRLSELSALEEENAKIKAQLAAMEKTDGEDTTKIEDTGADDTRAEYASRALAAYKKLKNT